METIKLELTKVEADIVKTALDIYNKTTGRNRDAAYGIYRKIIEAQVKKDVVQ